MAIGHNGKNGKNGNGSHKVKKEVKELLGAPMIGAEPNLNTLKLSKEVFDVWKMRMDGKSVLRISQELGLPPGEIMAMIEAAHESMKSDITQMAEIGRSIDLDRIDRLFESWFPVAQETDVIMQMVVNNEPMQFADIDRPLKALFGCIELIKIRAKLMNYDAVADKSAAQKNLAELLRYLDSSKQGIRELTSD